MKRMKKISAVTAAFMLSISTMAMTAMAEENADAEAVNDTAAAQVSEAEPITVVVNVSVEGEAKMFNSSVYVTDIDKDGTITIDEALYAAHDAGYNEGVENGYATAETQWGLSLTKLWGVENGGSYGYYVNNKAAMSLSDPLAEGDYLDAFAYKDTTGYSDAYTFFDKRSVELDLSQTSTFELNLSYVGYDADWNTVTLPLKDAVITIDGEKTDFVTDENGNVTITADQDGVFRVSAVSDSMILVPPACDLMVEGAEEKLPEGEEENGGDTENEGETENTDDEENEQPEQTEKADDEKAPAKEDSKPAVQTTATANPKTSSCETLALGFASLGIVGMLVSKRRNK